MNVWKFIYIKFFEFMCKVMPSKPKDSYLALLFVFFIDSLFFLGVVLVIYKPNLESYSIIDNWPLLIFFVAWTLSIENLHYRSMFKGRAFNRTKKEVKAEPRKILWSCLSVLYILLAISFFLFSLYVNKNR